MDKVSAFIREVTEAKELIDRIQETVDNHMWVGPDNVDWAHVGDAARLKKDLTDIVEYLK